MKKTITFLMLLVALINLKTYGQDFVEKKHSEEFIKSCILEVFQEKAAELVFNNNSYRYTLMRDFLKNQVVVEYRPEYVGKAFESTNSLHLNDKYTPSIQRHQSYKKGLFNPLIYAISMTPQKTTMYRIANSDYIMIVYPKN